ncbi:MAG: hypothetical protein ACO1O6_15160 [Bacteroidota bacterium]
MENEHGGKTVVSYHQFPHEEFMRSMGLETDKLEVPLQRQIEAFNHLYYEKSYDGILTDDEMSHLNNASLKITEQLKERYGEKESDDGTGVVLGVLGSIVVGFLGYLGIKKITKL